VNKAGLWVLAATLAGVVLTASLGRWQLDRAAQKLALQAATDARAAMPSLAAAELARGNCVGAGSPSTPSSSTTAR
jgi:surfeit locus 1 family protein